MLKSFIRLFLVFRLESRPTPIELSTALTAWFRRPSIEIFVEQRHRHQDLQSNDHLKHRLNEVYPF